MLNTNINILVPDNPPLQILFYLVVRTVAPVAAWLATAAAARGTLPERREDRYRKNRTNKSSTL